MTGRTCLRSWYATITEVTFFFEDIVIRVRVAFVVATCVVPAAIGDVAMIAILVIFIITVYFVNMEMDVIVVMDVIHGIQ